MTTRVTIVFTALLAAGLALAPGEASAQRMGRGGAGFGGFRGGGMAFHGGGFHGGGFHGMTFRGGFGPGFVGPAFHRGFVHRGFVHPGFVHRRAFIAPRHVFVRRAFFAPRRAFARRAFFVGAVPAFYDAPYPACFVRKRVVLTYWGPVVRYRRFCY